MKMKMFGLQNNFDWRSNKELPWKCHKCSSRFKFIKLLREHIKTEHAY